MKRKEREFKIEGGILGIMEGVEIIIENEIRMKKIEDEMIEIGEMEEMKGEMNEDGMGDKEDGFLGE